MSDVLASKEMSYFVTYSSIVLLKMVDMSPITSFFRLRRGVFSNPEDLPLATVKDNKVVTNDSVVERVRRCHLNDLENIVPFFGLGLLYALFSGASTSTLLWHYRIFTVSRLLHTVVYLYAVPQPARFLCFLAGFGVNVSMGVQILMNNFNL
ncbi:microsomal glutathione S-transferase 1-like [Diadema antillarum]|uniref:microsomal glutathione S-transferase 1-like n=1 Tax=Diadema antillarum TaxID=105358 RepID=UPI003A859D69